MQVWMTEQPARVPGRSTITESFRYALSHWKGLAAFLDDGRAALDTNVVEPAMRRVALRESDNATVLSVRVNLQRLLLGTILEPKRSRRRRVARIPKDVGHARRFLKSFASRVGMRWLALKLDHD
jgi:hypothetical protein